MCSINVEFRLLNKQGTLAYLYEFDFFFFLCSPNAANGRQEKTIHYTYTLRKCVIDTVDNRVNRVETHFTRSQSNSYYSIVYTLHAKLLEPQLTKKNEKQIYDVKMEETRQCF